MKKFRVKPYSYEKLGLRYYLQMRYLLLFWIDLKDFIDENKAQELCEKT